jgi:hypothetical protein
MTGTFGATRKHILHMVCMHTCTACAVSTVGTADIHPNLGAGANTDAARDTVRFKRLRNALVTAVQLLQPVTCSFDRLRQRTNHRRTCATQETHADGCA